MYPRKEWPKLLERIVDPCVNVIIEKEKSLGLIKPTINACYFADNEAYKTYRRMTIDGSFQVQEKNEYEYEPRVNYTCPECTTKQVHHDHQILEWGAYEYMRKNPREIDRLWENFHFEDPEWEKFFFVENQILYLKSFMIISVLRFKQS